MPTSPRPELPRIGNSLELAKLMDKLHREHHSERWNAIRCSEAEYQSGQFILRVKRRQVAVVSERTLQSGYFFLYCRVYYRSNVGYPGRRTR